MSLPSFNRTIVELKRECDAVGADMTEPFNRPIVELKLLKKKDGVVCIRLLIDP